MDTSIRIVDWDENRTQPNMQLLKLSDRPDARWTRLFDSELRQHVVCGQARPIIEGQHVIVRCPEGELQRYIDELRPVMRSVNELYDAQCAEEAAR